MEFKYIMFERIIDDCIPQKIPVVFPKELAHSNVADRLMLMPEFIDVGPTRIVSAGFIQISFNGISCYGSSESLKLDSNKEDSLIIASFDRLNGILEA